MVDDLADLGIGSALRASREEQGREIEEIARTTKVRGDYLRALEAEEFSRMGGDVYAKGFLKTYALALNMDPEELLTIYRQRVQGSSLALSGSLAAAPVAREPRGAPPVWIVWSIVGFIVLVGVIALANLIGGTSPEPAAQPRPPTAVTETETETATPTPTPTPTPTFDGVNVVLTFDADCWIRVFVDGVQVHEAVQKTGTDITFQATENVRVMYGNSGGARVTLNGRDLGVVGETGNVEDRTYTEDGST